jgi:hypothetical protein
LRVAIVGSRTFCPEWKKRCECPQNKWVRNHVARRVAELITRYGSDDLVILSGLARGVDTWAKQAADTLGVEVEEYPADWDRYGKGAGYRRNEEMIGDADMVFAYWDGESLGTNHAISLAEERMVLEGVVRV